MSGIAIVILVLIGGLALSVKGRAAGAAAWFSGLAVLCVVSTPLGSHIPHALMTVMSVVDGASAPVLAGGQPGHDGSGAERAAGVDR